MRAASPAICSNLSSGYTGHRFRELALTELKMSLSPGKAGRNNALAIFIKNVAAARPGLWNNELRISRTAGLPRSTNDYLAKQALSAIFQKGWSNIRR